MTFNTVKTYAPHQERVLEEAKELNVKRDKLTEFLKGEIFPKLPANERERLERQLRIMSDYSQVLSERIVNF